MAAVILHDVGLVLLELFIFSPTTPSALPRLVSTDDDSGP